MRVALVALCALSCVAFVHCQYEEEEEPEHSIDSIPFKGSHSSSDPEHHSLFVDRKKREASDDLAEELHMHHRAKRSARKSNKKKNRRAKKSAKSVESMAQDGGPVVSQKSFEEIQAEKEEAEIEDKEALEEIKEEPLEGVDDEDVPLAGIKLPSEEEGDTADDMAMIATLLSKAQRIGEVTHLLRKYGKDLKKEAEEEAVREKKKKAEEKRKRIAEKLAKLRRINTKHWRAQQYLLQHLEKKEQRKLKQLIEVKRALKQCFKKCTKEYTEISLEYVKKSKFLAGIIDKTCDRECKKIHKFNILEAHHMSAHGDKKKFNAKRIKKLVEQREKLWNKKMKKLVKDSHDPKHSPGFLAAHLQDVAKWRYAKVHDPKIIKRLLREKKHFKDHNPGYDRALKMVEKKLKQGGVLGKWYAERDPGLKEEEREHEEEAEEVGGDDEKEATYLYEEKKRKALAEGKEDKEDFHPIAFQLTEKFIKKSKGGKQKPKQHLGRDKGGDGAFKFNADSADDRKHRPGKRYLDFRNILRNGGGMKSKSIIGRL